MNFFNRLICVGALLIAPTLLHAESFTGKVTFAMTNTKGKPMTMNYAMKDTAVRIDFEGMPGGVIMDFAKKEMIILMLQQRMYMIRPIKPSDLPRENLDKKMADIDVESTGKTEKILGYTCNQILVKDGKNVTEAWVTDGLGTFAGLGNQGSGGGGGMFGKRSGNSEAAAKWEQALKGKGGFPLRVITHDAGGKETFTMEATKIQKGGVSDADFSPPADFQKFEMPNLGGMFKG